MNYAKLKGVLAEKNKSYDECSRGIGISITSFSNKMNGKRKFSVPEANALSSFLKLSNDEKLSIFFDK